MNSKNEKLQELLLYVVDEHPGSLPRDVFQTIAVTEFNHYVNHGESITKSDYIKVDSTSLRPENMADVYNQLRADGSLVLSVDDSLSDEEFFFALRPKDPTKFSKEELDSIEGVLGYNRSELENAESTRLGLELGQIGEVIPYQSALIYNGPLSDEDVKRAQQIAKDLNL